MSPSKIRSRTPNGCGEAATNLREPMSKKPSGAAAGNSEAIRIYERMEEERQRKVQAKAEANKPKKVTLPKLKFLDQK